MLRTVSFVFLGGLALGISGCTFERELYLPPVGADSWAPMRSSTVSPPASKLTPSDLVAVPQEKVEKEPIAPPMPLTPPTERSAEKLSTLASGFTGPGHLYVHSGQLKARSRKDFAAIIRSDNRKVLRVPAHEIMLQSQELLAKELAFVYGDLQSFADWLQASPDVTMVKCTPELLARSKVAMVDGGARGKQKFSYERRPTNTCYPGEFFFAFGGKPFLSNVCFQPRQEAPLEPPLTQATVPTPAPIPPPPPASLPIAGPRACTSYTIVVNLWSRALLPLELQKQGDALIQQEIAAMTISGQPGALYNSGPSFSRTLGGELRQRADGSQREFQRSNRELNITFSLIDETRTNEVRNERILGSGITTRGILRKEIPAPGPGKMLRATVPGISQDVLYPLPWTSRSEVREMRFFRGELDPLKTSDCTGNTHFEVP